MSIDRYDEWKLQSPDDIYAEAPEDTHTKPLHEYECRCCGHRGCSSRPEVWCIRCDSRGCTRGVPACGRAERGAA